MTIDLRDTVMTIYKPTSDISFFYEADREDALWFFDVEAQIGREDTTEIRLVFATKEEAKKDFDELIKGKEPLVKSISGGTGVEN